MTKLKGRLCQVWYLDAALINRTAAQAIYQGSVDDCSPNLRLLGGEVLEQVIDNALR